MNKQALRVVALAGGVGGAKLAHGLYQVLAPEMLGVVVNTADDFVYWGLHISPDVDTVMYTLAGIANEVTGWGITDETWNALEATGRLQGETWFRVGDKDLATHLRRTEALRAGQSLSDVTRQMARALGIHADLLPMSDDPVATIVHTPDGPLHFQDYFVRRQHRDPVHQIELTGIEQASRTRAVDEAISRAQVIIFCPSNPLVSIGPILAIPGTRELLSERQVPRVAVSPIIGGKALKGPADTMLQGLGHEPSALGVARLYQGLLSGLVIDHADEQHAAAIRELGYDVLVTDTIMRGIPDRQRLADTVLAWCAELL
jgi:LPPG:FO 2-phospho-L-lactate transferase